MPGRDKTGPTGEGPMTGRAAGLCVGTTVPASMVATGGQGVGRQDGCRGGRRRFRANGLLGRKGSGMGGPPFDVPDAHPDTLGPAATPQQELSVLAAQVESCRKTLEETAKRIAELQSVGSQSERNA